MKVHNLNSRLTTGDLVTIVNTRSTYMHFTGSISRIHCGEDGITVFVRFPHQRPLPFGLSEVARVGTANGGSK